LELSLLLTIQGNKKEKAANEMTGNEPGSAMTIKPETDPSTFPLGQWY
jgi:hypothetical protein